MPKKSIKVISKKRDRLPTSRDPVLAIQLPDELMHAVDKWATDHGMSRSEAITELLGQALALARSTTKDSRAKAAELAAQEIDKVSNSSAPDEERQKRKRRLLEGPREFRSTRRR